MSEAKIRLDRSRPFSTCHGDRTPDDPLFRVQFWQGGFIGPHRVLLPFDAHGELVEDDGQIVPKPGIDPDGKAVQFKPLYDANMRKFLAAKLKKAAALATMAPAEVIKEDGDKDEDSEGLVDETPGDDDVNLEAWLRGDVSYPAAKIREAYRKRTHHSTDNLAQIVIDLVLEEGIVPESEVAPHLAKHIPPKTAEAAA